MDRNWGREEQIEAGAGKNLGFRVLNFIYLFFYLFYLHYL